MDISPKKSEFEGHSGSVFTLEKGPFAGDFFSSGSDGQVVFWNVALPKDGIKVASVPSSVYCLNYSPEKNELLIPANRDGLHLLDLNSGQEILSIASPNTVWFRTLRLTNGETVIAGSNGALFRLHADRKIVDQWLIGTADFRAMASHPTENLIALGDTRGFVSIINSHTFEVISEFQAHDSTIFSLTFYPVGNILVTAGKDAHLKLWQLDEQQKGVLIKDVAAHLFGIHDVALHPTRPILATASMDKNIKIWDAENLKLLRILDKTRHAGHGHSVNKLLWLEEPELLLSCSDDRTISSWNIFD